MVERARNYMGEREKKKKKKKQKKKKNPRHWNEHEAF